MAIILFRGNMPTLFHSKGDASAALAGGLYRRQPVKVADEPTTEVQADNDEVAERAAAEPPQPDSINVNSAPLAELTSIKGIGLAKGKELIEKRPYSAAEDLVAVTEAVDWVQLEESGVIWFG